MKTKDLTLTGLFAALIFAGTYFFKIPTGFANGYTHLGDGLLILAVLILGWKRGTIAAAIGMGLSDFIGGYFIWVIPTVIFKTIWAFTIGLFAYKLFKGKLFGWYLGAIIGGGLQIICYTSFKIYMYGSDAALLSLPLLTAQTVIGIILATVVYNVLGKSIRLNVIS